MAVSTLVPHAAAEMATTGAGTDYGGVRGAPMAAILLHSSSLPYKGSRELEHWSNLGLHSHRRKVGNGEHSDRVRKWQRRAGSLA
jgi:hypothetical protein